MSLPVAGGIAVTAVVGGLIGAGVTALATRDSDSGDGARGTAKGLSIAGGVTGGLGVVGLGLAFASNGGFLDDLAGMVLFGIPGIGLMGIGAGLAGAAAGTALVAAARD